MAAQYCPECRNSIELGNQPFEGQRVSCSGCGAALEVINLDPPELDWVYYELCAQPTQVWEEM